MGGVRRMRWGSCHRRGALLFFCTLVILCLWGVGGGDVDPVAAEVEGISPHKSSGGHRRHGGWFSGGGDVLVVPTQPGTYLCEYMANATMLPQGCVQSCGIGGEENGKDFNCYVYSKYHAAELRRADIVINHNGPVPSRSSGQQLPRLTLFYTGESNHTDKKRGTEAYQRLYDVVVSFHHHRRYYFTWTHRQQPHFLKILHDNNQPLTLNNGDFGWGAWRRRHSAVAVFVSRCKARRAEFIRRLSRHYPVHSFGACARNRAIPSECARLAGRYPQKLCVFQKYKYAMALENSNETDYVTEKVYHALLSGAVPLYWGAPNVEEFLPSGRGSVVEVERLLPGQLGDDAAATANANDAFQGFGEYLRRLEGDEASVRRLLQWRLARRTEEWGEGFLGNLYHPDPLCAVCAEARVRRGKDGVAR